MPGSKRMVWEEPAPQAKGVGRSPKYATEIAALKRRKGKWAVLLNEPNTPESATAAERLQQAARHGRWAFIPKGQFEAVIRKTDKRIKVYVRFVGETIDDGSAPEPY